jgi:hypothetical protein
MCVPYNESSGNYRISVFTLERFEMTCPGLTGKNVRIAIEGCLAMGLVIPLIRRIYVIQEFLAALVLFSIVCAAGALLVTILLLTGVLVQKLFLKPRVVCEPIILRLATTVFVIDRGPSSGR